MSFFSTSHVFIFLFVLSLLGNLEYPGVSYPSFFFREENTTLLASALMRSVESIAEPVVCGTVNSAGFSILAEIAVALERNLPCEVVVGSSQQAVGDSGSDVALVEVSVFGMLGGAVLLAPTVVVRSPQSLSCRVGSSAGAAVAALWASSALPIVGERYAVYPLNEPQCEPVDELMRSVEGPVCPSQQCPVCPLLKRVSLSLASPLWLSSVTLSM